jgi:UDP-glucose 4-epimerase
MPRDRVVVTGGAGFIGGNLCRALSGAGFEVMVLDDLSTGSPDNLGGLDVTLVEGTVLDPIILANLCAGARCVVHLAARASVPRSLEDPVATHQANATGTLLVLEAARAVGAHVIVASSSSVYGANPELPKTESAITRPISPYAASKLAAEGYALAYQQCFSLPSLVFRFFNVFGPLQAAGHPYAAVVPRFIDAALQSRPVEIHGDGRQTRDFTYVDTVVRVLLDAVSRRVAYGGPVNLAFGSRVSILDLVHELEGTLARPLQVRHTEPRAGDVRHSQADQRLLLSLFPTATATPLANGLMTTVQWYRSRSTKPSVTSRD